MPTTVYRSRSRTMRTWLLVTAGAVVLVLTGFLIGRSRSGGDPAAAAPTPPPAASQSAGSPRPLPPAVSAAPTSGRPTPAGGIDAYATLQAEDAASQKGVEMEDTTDEGGGRNAGYVNAGDWLRFADVEFGTSPPTAVHLRVASDSRAGGRVEIRLGSPEAAPSATLTVSHTGGWQDWRTETTGMAPVTGRQTVYVTFGSDRSDDLVNLNWLTFRR